MSIEVARRRLRVMVPGKGMEIFLGPVLCDRQAGHVPVTAFRYICEMVPPDQAEETV